LRRTGSVALLHCQETTATSGREITLGMADVVFELERSVDSSDVETYLLV